MNTRSPAWRWFAMASLLSAILAGLGTAYLMADRLADSGGDPALAPPMIAVAVSVLMTYFGILIPMLAAIGVVVVILDTQTRKRR
jgi:hypothetical protein